MSFFTLSSSLLARMWTHWLELEQPLWSMRQCVKWSQSTKTQGGWDSAGHGAPGLLASVLASQREN